MFEKLENCPSCGDSRKKWNYDFQHCAACGPGNNERSVIAEARNIARNFPVFSGDTISHATAKECERRGWAQRNDDGDWMPTANCPFSVTSGALSAVHGQRT